MVLPGKKQEIKIKISLKDHLHISELIGAGRLPVVIFK
jgi:hypothetical protein